MVNNEKDEDEPVSEYISLSIEENARFIVPLNRRLPFPLC